MPLLCFVAACCSQIECDRLHAEAIVAAFTCLVDQGVQGYFYVAHFALGIRALACQAQRHGGCMARAYSKVQVTHGAVL